MPPKGKFKVLFPRNSANVLPDPTTGPSINICINREWIPFLLGQLYHLRWKGLVWDGTEEEQRIMHEYVEKFMAMLEQAECNMINNIRFFESKLQMQFCGSSEWFDVGTLGDFGVSQNGQSIQFDINGDGINDVTQYFNSYENIYGEGLPPVTNADLFCRVSWALAKSLCDDYTDFIELVRVANNVSASIAQSLAELFPPTALADDTIETVSQDIPVAVWDFMLNNSEDDDTIKRVAEWIYCSLEKNYPNQLGDVIDDIPLGLYQPLIESVGGAKHIKWLNMGEIAQSIYDTALGKNVSYMVVAFAKSSLRQMVDKMGLYEPNVKVIEGALSSATFLSGADCEDFPDCNTWCYQWDFLVNDGGWEVISGTNSLGLWTVGVGWQNQPWAGVPANRNLNIKFTFPANVQITDIEMMYVITDLGADSAINLSCGGGEFSTSVGTHNQSVDVDFDDDVIAINSNFVNRGLAVKSVIFRGNGELPEGFSDGVICGS